MKKKSYWIIVINFSIQRSTYCRERIIVFPLSVGVSLHIKCQSHYSNRPFFFFFFFWFLLGEFMDAWYLWKLPQAFSYNALGFLNGNLTSNISRRKNKVHLDKSDISYMHILHTITKRDKVSQTVKKKKKKKKKKKCTKAVPPNKLFR